MSLQEELEKQGIWLFRYRGTLPLIVLLIGTILYLRTEIYPETFFLEETPYEIYFEMLCLLVSLFGLAIRVYTVGYTPRNTSGRNIKKQVADKLNTTGIYSIVRHPLYLGNFFMCAPQCLLAISGSLLLFVFFIGCITSVLCLPKNSFYAVNLEISIWNGQKIFLLFFLILRIFKNQLYPLAGKKCLERKRMACLQYLSFSLFLIPWAN